MDLKLIKVLTNSKHLLLWCDSCCIGRYNENCSKLISEKTNNFILDDGCGYAYYFEIDYDKIKTLEITNNEVD